jgi:hypothetical protein
MRGVLPSVTALLPLNHPDVSSPAEVPPVRAPLRRVLTAVSVVVVTLTLGGSSVGLGQDATQGPAETPSPFCSVLTAAEVTAALGVTITVGTGSETDCSYDADFTTSDVSLNAHREDGPLTDDYPRSWYPDGIDIPCDPAGATPGDASTTEPSVAPCPPSMTGAPFGDHAAYYVADGTMLFVDEGANDQLFVLQLFGTPPDSVDVAAGLISLAQAGLPRLAAIPLPPEPTIEPDPSYFGDAELSAMIPTEIGGNPVDVQTLSGADIINQTDPSDPDATDQLQSLEAALSGMGKSIDDLSIANASFPTESSFGNITALRLNGADISSLTDDLLPLLLSDIADPTQTSTVIAGKTVIIVTDGPKATGSPDPSADPYAVGSDLAYVYPKGEVLWLVTATEPELSEIFQKLP